MQLSVTPREEGILEILGVRWKFSGSIVGFHNFEFCHLKKNTGKERRKGKGLPNENFKFLVIKVFVTILHFFTLLLSVLCGSVLSNFRLNQLCCTLKITEHAQASRFHSPLP